MEEEKSFCEALSRLISSICKNFTVKFNACAKSALNSLHYTRIIKSRILTEFDEEIDKPKKMKDRNGIAQDKIRAILITAVLQKHFLAFSTAKLPYMPS